MLCSGFRIQPDWEKAFASEKEEKVWFHHYQSGKVEYSYLTKRDLNLTPDVGHYSCNVFSSKIVQLYAQDRTRTTFQCPDTTVDSIYSHQRPPQMHLCCADLSPSTELVISAGSDGIIHVWESETATIRRTLSGHVGEIYSCRFFPSGMAALTSSADMQLKIWCISTGTCAATLAPGLGGGVTGVNESPEPGGHCSGVLDTGIVDRGRNIVSVDRLGWLRLWDVSTQICISAIPTVPDAICNQRRVSTPLEECVCLAVKEHNNHRLSASATEECDSTAKEPSEPKAIETCSTTATEVGTNDCLVAVGMGIGGAVQLYELGARSQGCVLRVCLPEKGGSVESCTFPVSLTSDPLADDPKADMPTAESPSAVNSFLQYGLLAGGQTGEVAGWDLRYPTRTLIHLTEEKSAAHHLRAYKQENEHSVQLMVGRSDGRVVVHRTMEDSPRTDETERYLELTGIDCEPVVALQVLPGGSGGKGVQAWTASYGGVFRFYKRMATQIAFQK